jgi:hypothetical protein
MSMKRVRLRNARPTLLPVLVTALALTLVGVATNPAAAAPARCLAADSYSYSNVRASHVTVIPYVQGDPGHTLSIQISAGTTIQASLTGTATGGISAVVAGAQTSVSASLSVAMTASVTYGDSWTVPTNVHHGYLDVGASSDAMTWKHGYYTPTCTWVIDHTGTLNSPWHLPSFWSWTT